MGIKVKSEFGIPNYHLPKSFELDKPQIARIYPGIKKTYLDDA